LPPLSILLRHADAADATLIRCHAAADFRHAARLMLFRAMPPLAAADITAADMILFSLQRRHCCQRRQLRHYADDCRHFTP
jgi:hypothetical protein